MSMFSDRPDANPKPAAAVGGAPPRAPADSPVPPVAGDVKGLFGGASPTPGNNQALANAGRGRMSNEAVSQLFGSSASLALVPPAAGSAHTADEDDPVANLFRANPVQRAPTISLHPTATEAVRTLATGRTSMFDEQVMDPPPPARPVAVSLTDAAAHSGPAARAPAPPNPDSALRGRTTAQPVPYSAEQTDTTAAGGNKKPVPPAPPQAATAAKDAPAPAARRRRISTGPSKTVLAGLAVLTVLVAGASAAVLGIMPDPWGSPPNAPIAPIRISQPAIVTPARPPSGSPAVVQAPAAQLAKPVAVVVAVPAAQPVAAGIKLPVAKPVVVPTPVAAVAPAPTPAAAAPNSQDERAAGSSSDKLVREARELLAADDAVGAEALARQALIVDPSDHHAMEVLARTLMDQDRGAEALPYARIIVRVRRNRVPYWLLYGDLLLMTGDEAGARGQWHTALELDPTDRDIKRRLGL